MAAPRVSIICIFLNEGRFLAEAIESVLGQDFRDFELILADDGSTDSSSEIARGYAARHPGQLIYVDHPGHANRGMSATRNLGLSKCRGVFVAAMDGDDRWLPCKVGEQVALLDANPAVGMVCGGYRFWRSWDGGEDSEYFSGHRFDRASNPPEALLALYPLGRALNPTDAMVRRDIVERVGGWEDTFPGLYEDVVFHSKVFLESGVIFARRIWHDYRTHAASCTQSAEPGADGRWRVRYFDWLEAYLAEHPERDDPRIHRAIARGRRELRYPAAFGAYYAARRLAGNVARKTGLIHLLRREATR
ncbi:glycosyltransferase family 2 protein [Tsuneonella sp. HG222]